jgi:uncharacterized protein (DUF433 family)
MATGSSRKGKPFSVRFSGPTDRAIEAEARRVKRSKGAVVEALAEEAMRMRRFPGIGFRDDEPNRRPWLIGTGLDVWELCEMIEDYSSVDELVSDFRGFTHRHVQLALAYRDAYPDEIEQAIAENRRSPEEWRELYPFVRSIEDLTK